MPEESKRIVQPDANEVVDQTEVAREMEEVNRELSQVTAELASVEAASVASTLAGVDADTSKAPRTTN